MFAADFQTNLKLILLSQDLKQMLVTVTLVSVTSVKFFLISIILSNSFLFLFPISSQFLM